MKVNRPEIINIIEKIYKLGEQGRKEKPAAASAPSGSDRLEISSSMEILKKELARLEESDPLRREKVAELARQVSSGQYKVDSRKLAEHMLKSNLT